MDHLGGVDATFLYTETPETPMHVGSLNVYELPPGYKGDFVADVRRHIGDRLHLAPVFRRKLLAMQRPAHPGRVYPGHSPKSHQRQNTPRQIVSS